MNQDFHNEESLLQAIQMGPQFKKLDALEALYELTNDKHIDLFLSMLKDKDWHIRRTAGIAVAKMLGACAKEHLTPLLNDRAYGVREDIRKAIEEYC
ncbi:HEAT repeat domain-containing protein [Alicyclobacillus mengziensis]|uniref:HEAT repeat domain-containing protein n=1 Tax=Alicyclobacillus mengziensis TaxID=2931921 RepID=A0A9X7W337_9BACL|nr:HEAT repeat domain-containing protein [Alicyclobacillus mengziensis]QSO48383.1 HEAT repeat domain-containing protein [Alicyclobacillus mengziensis]